MYNYQYQPLKRVNMSSSTPIKKAKTVGKKQAAAAVKKQKKEQLPPGTIRCQGCGLLLANNRSVSDHEMFCEGVETKHELTPIRGIEFVQGDLRGMWK